jgi:hypothetical protein
LSAEVLLDAIAQITEVPSEFNQIGYDGNDFQETTAYPRGTRAIELYDSAVVSSFLRTFGRNERDITCECERSNTPNIVQVLHISNGTTINDRLKDTRSCLAQAATTQDAAAVIHEAFLRVLARPATPAETTSLLPELQVDDPGERRLRIEDLYWSLMSTREFVFNH